MKSQRSIEILIENKNFTEAWVACRGRLQSTQALADQILAAKVFFQWYYMNRDKKSYLWLAALCIEEGISVDDMKALQKPKDDKGHDNPACKLLDEVTKALQTVKSGLDDSTAISGLPPAVRADFYLTRGHIRRNLNNQMESQQDYQQVIQIHIDYRQTLTEIKRSPNPESTLATLTASAGLAWRMLAELHRDHGDIDEELSALAEAARLMPDDPVIHSIYGDRLCSHGRHAEAVAELEIAVQCRLQHAIEAKTLRGAKVTLHTQQLKAAAEAKPEDEASQFHYAEHLINFLQNFREALPILEKLQERWPDHPDLPGLLASARRAIPNGSNLRLTDLQVSSETSPVQQLWQAAGRGDLARVKSLRDNPVDLTAQDEKGNTALHYAAQAGHPALISILYQNYNTQNKQHQTPIQLAAAEGHADMVKKLLEQGVNLEGVLESAIIAGKTGVLKFFLDSHYPYRDRLVQNSGGMTTLVHAAIQWHQIEILRFLVESEPYCRDALYQGQTPLHRAIQERNEQAIDVLFDLFADPLRKNDAKQTPGELAAVLAKTKLEHVKKYEALAAKLASLVKQGELRAEKLLGNMAAVIDGLRKQLVNQKEWSFLKEKRNLIYEKILKTALENDLRCQRYLCADQPDLSVLTSYLTSQILAAQSSVLKVNTLLSNELQEMPLRRVITVALQKPWQRMDEKNLEKVKGGQSPEESKSEKSDRSRVLSREQDEFVNKFEDEFDVAYSKFRALHGGDVIYTPDEKDQIAGLVKTVAAGLPNVQAPIPGVDIAIPTGKIVGAAVDVGLYMRNRWRKQYADRMCRLFESCLPSERNAIIRFAAVCMADKYRHQLAHLESGEFGISRFAACAAQRIIDYIISNDKHQIESEASTMDRLSRYLTACWTGKEIPTKLVQKKSLCSLFLDGMLRVTEYPGDVVHLRTIRGLTHSDQWTSKGLIENTGIMTPQGELFSHPECRVEIYGYVSGTEEEAKRRGLTNTNPKTKEPWQAGRQWESPAETPPRASTSPEKESKHLTTAARQGMTLTSSGSTATAPALRVTTTLSPSS